METKSLRAKKSRAGHLQKGIALFSQGGSLGAGMTVEAALALPLFLFFFCNLISALDMIRLDSKVTAALQQAGDQICEYAWYRDYARAGVANAGNFAGFSPGGNGGGGASPGGESASGGSDAEIPALAGQILAAGYVEGQVRGYLGDEYLNSACIRGGSGGISCARSHVLSEEGIVELHADYATRPFIRILNGPDLSLQATYYAHAFTGYAIGAGAGEAGEAGDAASDGKVIVAENGVVYHTDPDCPYLHPRIRAVDASDLGHLRANDGSIYHACEYCHPSASGTVYISPDGNRYHSSEHCSRIERTTHEETLDQAQSHLRPCPKCGGLHAQ